MTWSSSSLKINFPLVILLAAQNVEGEVKLDTFVEVKEINQVSYLKSVCQVDDLKPQSTTEKAIGIREGKGSATRLPTLHIKDHGYFLHRASLGML